MMKAKIGEAIQNAALDMMKQVKRIDNGRNHGYARVSDNKKLAGVTEVSSAAGYKEAKGWMPAWGGKEAVKCLGYFERFVGETHEEELKKAADMLKDFSRMNLEDYLALLHEAKSGHSRKSDKAKETGTDGHEWLETWVKARIRGKVEPELPEANEFVIDGLKEFMLWANSEIKEFILSEARVALPAEPYEYAGTMDVLAIMKDDKPAVLDFKFADNKSISWPLQLVAYAETFRPYNINVSERYALRFPKSEFLKEWDKEKAMYKKIPNKFEVIRYNPEYNDFDFKTFMHYRAADRWVNAMIK